jgi:hypothetical protein
MTPPAALMASIAWSMTELGVSSGYETITALRGTAALSAIATKRKIEERVNLILTIAFLDDSFS